MNAQADGERQAATLKAEGQKQSAILQAEGERQAAVLRTKGAGAPQRSYLKAKPKRHTPTVPLHPQGRGHLPLRQNPVAHGAVHPPTNPRQEEGRVPPTSPLLRGEPDRRRPQTPPQPQSVLGRDETPFFGDRHPPSRSETSDSQDAQPDHRDPGESRRRHSGPTETTPTASRRRLKTARRDPPAPPRQTASLRRVNRRGG